MSGNPWIAQQREQAFRSQLNDKNVWINVAAMALSEGTPQQSVESLFNRTMYVNANGWNKTLMNMITEGFYGPYDRGEYPNFIAQIRASQAKVDMLNAAIEAVMAGADTIQGFTDQGLPTDPNGQHQPQIKIGGNVFNDWGGGPNSHAGAAAWREEFEARAAAEPPTPTPVPVPTDPYAPIIAMLKAAGKLPTPTIVITTVGEVTVIINGKQMS